MSGCPPAPGYGTSNPKGTCGARGVSSAGSSGPGLDRGAERTLVPPRSVWWAGPVKEGTRSGVEAWGGLPLQPLQPLQGPPCCPSAGPRERLTASHPARQAQKPSCSLPRRRIFSASAGEGGRVVANQDGRSCPMARGGQRAQSVGTHGRGGLERACDCVLACLACYRRANAMHHQVIWG